MVLRYEGGRLFPGRQAQPGVGKRNSQHHRPVSQLASPFEEDAAESGGEGARERTEQSFLMDKEEITQNDYNPSINKYKKVEYVPVEYPPTKDILEELRKLEKEITAGLDELEGML